MKNLLKTTIQRRISIIGILRDFIDWQDPQLLANLLDCSVKTLLSDVEAINHDWHGKIGIEYSRTKGLRLEDSMQNMIRPLTADIMEDSESFQFIEGIFFYPNEDVDFWMKELYISEATFYRMVRQIDEVLSRKDLVLKRKPFRIVAEDERWVRIFYVQFFLEKYGLNSWPFKTDRSRMLEFVQESSQTFDIILNDRDKMEYSFLLSIIIIRCYQGFEMSDETIPKVEESIYEELQELYPSAEKAVEGTPFGVSKKWYQEVVHSLFFDCFVTDQNGDAERVRTEIEDFLSQLIMTFKIPLHENSQKRIVQKMMRIYHGFQVYPQSRVILFNEAAFFGRAAQRQYPHFTKKVQKLLVELEHQTSVPWFSQFYFAVLRCLFMEWLQLVHYLDVLSLKRKVLIISDSGRRHGEMLADLVKSRFFYQVETSVYDDSIFTITEETFQKFERYDLILSNTAFDEYPRTNLIVVDDFLTDADYTVISAFINQIK
ncbi:hypothetical protein NRIC_17830 [Enterococcus florum]|uniref:Mga helix-turn-helix domain-containing protein n=1 Tax=Enterococcus florum TaxID=2480627 RepID=A0A4P5PE59_9ENTE|nr:helix-turn-helix domain-containing protein [Enterococcus florum]GCF93892.1 hypothetical protein NRIC_17830 [Enterococcus florum]